MAKRSNLLFQSCNLRAILMSRQGSTQVLASLMIKPESTQNHRNGFSETRFSVEQRNVTPLIQQPLGRRTRETLAEEIRARLQRKKSCTVFENRFEHLWPRDQVADKRREEQIRAFAASQGLSVTILNPGIRVTFRNKS
jgi:hypothetical protein